MKQQKTEEVSCWIAEKIRKMQWWPFYNIAFSIFLLNFAFHKIEHNIHEATFQRKSILPVTLSFCTYYLCCIFDHLFETGITYFIESGKFSIFRYFLQIRHKPGRRNGYCNSNYRPSLCEIPIHHHFFIRKFNNGVNH